MRFVFDIRKSIAATAYLCRLNGGRLNILHLIKMLYAADRMALVEWNRTITGDKFCSMKHGPVLSRLYDLMRGDIQKSTDMIEWSKVFNVRKGNEISLKSTGVDLDPLSERETEALEKAYKTLRKVPAGELIDFLHKALPEWKDPGNSSSPINPKDILIYSGFSEEEANEIESDIDLVQAAKLAFDSVHS